MITYRTQKGAPLTIDEMDGNFKDIEDRLKALEGHLESGEGISKIHVEGDTMRILGTFGTELGTFILPKATFTPRGPWSPEISYQALDVVSHSFGLYYCIQRHLSTTWEHDAVHFQEIFKFPQAAQTLLLYEKATLPAVDTLGKLALLMEGEGPTLIFFDGKGWKHLMKGDIL